MLTSIWTCTLLVYGISHGLGPKYLSWCPNTLHTMLRVIMVLATFGEVMSAQIPAFSVSVGVTRPTPSPHNRILRWERARPGSLCSSGLPQREWRRYADNQASSPSACHNGDTEITRPVDRQFPRLAERLRNGAFDRRSLLGVGRSAALGLLALQVAVAPQAACAANSKRPLSLNLLTMMRIQDSISSMRQALSSPPQGATPPDVPAQVKYVLRGLDMRGNVEEACKVLRPSGKAQEARGHGIEALEYLSQIVEFSGYGELKRPGVSRLGALDTPERVGFALKCLAAAGRELDLFLSSFDTQTLDNARQLYQVYFPPQ